MLDEENITMVTKNRLFLALLLSFAASCGGFKLQDQRRTHSRTFRCPRSRPSST